MKTWLSMVGGLLVMAMACAAQNASATIPDAEAFGSLPFLSNPQLSPDGTYFAYMQSYKGRPVVTVNKFGDTSGKWPVAIPIPKMIIDGFQWVKNDKLILTLKWTRHPSGDQETFYHFVAVSADGKDAVPLTEGERPSENVTTDIRKRIHMLWVIDNADDSANSIYAEMSDGSTARVTLSTGAYSLLWTPSVGRIADWTTDGQGHPISRVERSFNPLVEHLQVNVDGRWREIATGSAEGDQGINIYGLSGDGKSLVASPLETLPFDEIQKIDLTNGYKRSSFFSMPNYDVTTAIIDVWSNRIIGAYMVSDSLHSVYFDQEMAAILRGLEANFPDQSVRIVSNDRSRSKIFFSVVGPTQPQIFYYLNRTTHEVRPIGRTYPKLPLAVLGQMKSYDYKARDGLDIPAFLTLPPTKQPTKLPLIVMPHGGPDARDAIDFHWWPQFYVSRGYAVFQPNYRGSRGYGRAFNAAGFKQWGLKMQDDITDGVKKLIADGIVDPKRICIVGASYGGYAALAGATLTPDLYACAVSVNGVSDLPGMMTNVAHESGYENKPYSFWLSRIGDPSKDADRLKATSPVYNAEKAKSPVLLLHSTGDTTVPIAQSEDMEKALRRAGRSVEFLRLEGDDHYLELSDTRVRLLTETERFIAKAIGN